MCFNRYPESRFHQPTTRKTPKLQPSLAPIPETPAEGFHRLVQQPVIKTSISRPPAIRGPGWEDVIRHALRGEADQNRSVAAGADWGKVEPVLAMPGAWVDAPVEPDEPLWAALTVLVLFVGWELAEII